MAPGYFTAATFDFLRQLAANNERDWFEAHKERYEQAVRQPALAFIADMAPSLLAIAPRFVAQPRKVGGSLMRIQRDVRFSRDKSPFKTNIGIQFRHEAGKDVHAPGYYLHIEPGGCFIGVGIWHPEPEPLFLIRSAIAEKGAQWMHACNDANFRRHFTPEGESLRSVPRGFDKAHPQIEEIKRKDFIASTELSEAQICSPELLPMVADHFHAAEPYMQFLCRALKLSF